MPFHAPPSADERSNIEGFLFQQQDAFRAAIHGLTEEQAALAPTPSTMSVGVLVKHAAWVQTGWLDQALCAPDPVPPPGPEAYAAHQEGWTWTEKDTVAGVVARLDEVSARVLDAVRRLDLDTPVPVPPAPWFPKDVEHWSVRWVWLHLVEELARHAGHADIIREAVDGATMYELMAAKDDFPDTDWVRKWRPAGRRPAG
jgi:hypothetical protein